MLTLHSPAKINLFLRIIGRSPDGYHELASLFQAIDLLETIQFSLADDDTLTCTDPSIPTDGSNLILKAAHLFRKKSGLAFGLKVHLEKNIPHQAGLGGGSGNAATTLWALNQLLGKPVGIDDLIEWSGEIGSDISFFLSRGTAYCTGRGEIVRPLPPLPGQHLWIIKPHQGTSTPAVYGKLDAAKLPARDPEATLHKFYSGTPDYYNDLEGAAFAVLPELAVIKRQLLEAGYGQVLLSGSGSSFFCIGDQAPPKVPQAQAYSVKFIQRPEHGWYT